MNENPYSNERAEARKKAREQGIQSTQRSWDNYSVGGASSMLPPSPQQSAVNAGEISKLVSDAVATLKQSLISEITQQVVAQLTGKDRNEEKKGIEKLNREPFEPTKLPPLNYKIASSVSGGGPFSAIFAEIPFKPDILHVLGLQGEALKWVPTEDC